MKKILMLVLFLIPLGAFAKSTYIYTDHKFNFVRVEKASKKDALKANHPFSFTDEAMRTILKNVKISRSFVVKKEVESQEVFDDRAVNLLTPNLIAAFSKATPADKIVVSYLAKNPQVILRNDRLTIMYLWMDGTDLHMKFEKLFAKTTGDYDKRGEFTKVANRAKGLRIVLEPQEGQSFGESTEELVVDATAVSGEQSAGSDQQSVISNQ